MPLLVVLSDEDPIAQRVAERWGTLPASDRHVEGAPIRARSPRLFTLRRPGFHIEDAGLDRSLLDAGVPGEWAVAFPSIHRSASGRASFTVHPLGVWGGVAEFGGRPGRLNPTAPRTMTAVLRALIELSVPLGVPASFEATHHGPYLAQPSFFVEFGGGPQTPIEPGQGDVIAQALDQLEEDPSDRVAVAVGGGHYAPRFSDLARRRRWAFGHILPRHALAELTAETVAEAWKGTPEAVGVLPTKAEEYDPDRWSTWGPRLREGDADARGAGPTPTRSRSGSSRSAGT